MLVSEEHTGWEARSGSEREKEAVRTAILQAARELFVSEGYRNVSMRKIAERIEYSPAAIYSYFPAKDDIFFALAEEGFRLLAAAGDRVLEDARRPARRRCAELFWAYYRFSREQPQYFELMFLDRTVPQISRAMGALLFRARDDARHVDSSSSGASTPGSSRRAPTLMRPFTFSGRPPTAPPHCLLRPPLAG